MQLHHAHDWDVSPAEARAIQSRLLQHVELDDRFQPPRTVAGVDVGVLRATGQVRAAVVVLALPELAELERSVVLAPARFPYVPGLLSFRELPAVLQAMDRLSALPDVVLCDGQGRAHPRRFGLACHLGVLLDLPTVGVAKSRLVGEHAEPGDGRGDRVPLLDGDEVIGAVLRSRPRVRPLYVSCGHRVSLASACELVLACTTRYRLPQTTRLADAVASARGWA